MSECLPLLLFLNRKDYNYENTYQTAVARSTVPRPRNVRSICLPLGNDFFQVVVVVVVVYECYYAESQRDFWSRALNQLVKTVAVMKLLKDSQNMK